ncbi:MAG: DEAD/DEAH box helicase, partial [Myxococcota bacterium]
MRAADYLLPGGILARSIPGYEHRISQFEMANAVESTLAEDGVLLVEAGTGTGKTLAYLLPAIASGRRVVVSTHTKAL